MDSERQGGPVWWRAWWWLLAWNPGQYVAANYVNATLLIVAAVLMIGAVAFATLGSVIAIGLGLLFAAGAAFFVRLVIPERPGVPVTAASQPDLYRSIERVAGHIGAPMPSRVLLDASVGIRTVAAGLRCDLRIGLPVLGVLSRTQVEALVAHELSPLRYRHPWLVLRLRAMRLEEPFTPDAHSVQRTGMLARLFDFWSMVEDDSDAAAISFGGARSAAEAVLRCGFASVEYISYSFGIRAPEPRDMIQDVEDGWPRHLARTKDLHTLIFEYDDAANEHTTLGDPIRRFGELRFGLAEGRVELAPLPQRDQRWLSRQSLFAPGPRMPWIGRRTHWYTFANAPARWWVARAEGYVAFVREQLEIPAEVSLPDALDDSDQGNEAFELYAEYELLKRGWRFEHPAVHGVLISPTDQRIDLSTMDRNAVIAILPVQGDVT